MKSITFDDTRNTIMKNIRTLDVKATIQESQYKTAYHWNENKRVETRRYHKLTELISKSISSRILPCSECTVIDIGCGDGRSTYYLHKSLVNNGHPTNIIGCDISKRAIELALHEVESRGEPIDINFICGSACDVINGISKDTNNIFIVMREVIEHLQEEQIDEILHCVRSRFKHPIIILTTPTTNSPVEEKHFRHYTVTTLSNTIKRSGYQVSDIIGFGFRPRILYSFLKKLKHRLNSSMFHWIMNPCWHVVPARMAITLVIIGEYKNGESSK